MSLHLFYGSTFCSIPAATATTNTILTEFSYQLQFLSSVSLLKVIHIFITVVNEFMKIKSMGIKSGHDIY